MHIPIIAAQLALDATWALWLLVVVLGVLLVVRGLRGKKTDNCPLCRRCGYDLSGSPDVPRCPECGRSVAGPKGRRIGRRKRQWAVCVAGVVLLVLCAGAAGVVRWADSTRFDWNTVKPCSLLLREAQRTGKTMDGMHDTPADRALLELVRRFNAGSLSKGQTSQLVATGLAVQADPALCWLDGWGEVIENARTRGLVTDAQWAAYLANSFQGCGVQLGAAPDPGKTTLSARVGRPRCAVQTQIQWSLILERVDVDGVVFTLGANDSWLAPWMSTSPRRHELAMTPPSGMAVVRTTWTLRVRANDLALPDRQIEEVQKVAVQRARSVQRPGG